MVQIHIVLHIERFFLKSLMVPRWHRLQEKALQGSCASKMSQETKDTIYLTFAQQIRCSEASHLSPKFPGLPPLPSMRIAALPPAVLHGWVGVAYKPEAQYKLDIYNPWHCLHCFCWIVILIATGLPEGF